MLVRLGALLLLLCVAGCADDRPSYYYWSTPAQKAAINTAQTTVTLPTAVAGTGPYVPDKVDGSYQGTAYLVLSPHATPAHWWRTASIGDQTCPHSTLGVVEIGDHVLYYAYAPNLIFNTPVSTDGTLKQTIANATISGKVAFGRLTFDIVTPVCTTRFFGTFKLNHS